MISHIVDFMLVFYDGNVILQVKHIDGIAIL